VKRRHLTYPLGLAFFTLPNNYSEQLHTQLWEMVYFGNGFTWDDVYSMPIHWRNFYFKKIYDARKKESDDLNNMKRKSNGPSVKVKR